MSKGSDLRAPEFTGTLGKETSSPESLVFDRLHEQADRSMTISERLFEQAKVSQQKSER